MVSLRGVSFSYADAPALIGTHGSGKSTLIKLLNGFALPRRGSYHFDGRLIDKAALSDQAFAKSFHQRIGFLFQNADAQLFCTSVREEVAFGPRQMGLPEEEIERRMEDCLTLLGIGALAAVFSAGHGLARTGPYAQIVADREFLASCNIL